MSGEKPKYRQNQEDAQRKRDKAAEDSDRSEIIAALKAVAEQQKRSNDEGDSERRLDRILEFATVVGIWGAAIIAILAIWRAGSDSSDQRAVMQGTLDEMQVEQRPWVYPDVALAGQIQFDGNTLNLALQYVLHNTGHLPAIGAWTRAEAYGRYRSVDFVSSEQRRICREMSAVKFPNGVSVFPGQTQQTFSGAPMRAHEIAIEKRFWNRASKALPMVSPTIVGCIDYQTPDGTHHQTAFAYDVSGGIKLGTAEYGGGIPLNPEPMEAKNWSLFAPIQGGVQWFWAN